MKKLLIRDLTLRDGQQSLFATRVRQEQIDTVLPLFKQANFYAMEVWGGAVPDSVMRFLNENPWDRLEKIKAGIGDSSKLTALSRGRNLFGYNPYPDEVIKGFNENAVKSGVDIMRIFDCLNDVDNMKSTIKYIKEAGGVADCAVCYTIDPKFTPAQKVKYLLKGKKIPKDIFTIDYFVQKAKLMEELGADIITIKDMAGLIPPTIAGKMVRALKNELNIPIDYHTHCTPGFGLASVLMAMINDVDIVDTNIMNFAGGSAAPAVELVQIFADKLGLDTGLNLKAIVKINKKLKIIRQQLAEFDSYKQFPIDFDITKDKLPVNIDKLFDEAIEFAKNDNEEKLLKVTHKIEDYFNFPKPNEMVKQAEIPGGMYTNMLAQLKHMKMEKLFPRVLSTVPMVRVDAGCPPLVTPSSQIVGVQAVNCVVDTNNNNPFYTETSVQFVNLVKGLYGKTPLPIDPKFRKKITGSEKEIPYDSSNYKKQENPSLLEFGGEKLAKNYKEELLLELFPSVATNFLKSKIEKRYIETKQKIEEAERKRYEKARAEYEKLTPEEKEKRLREGLYNFDWGSEKAE
ncbi:MAG: carboxylase [Bacteroidales bacterium]|nr:carboxylase [Bacteroidales bacterium]